MIRLSAAVPVLAALLFLPGVAVQADGQAETKSKADPPADALPLVEDLGNDRYRIGTIVVDRAGRNFTVPGEILHLDEPLEYLAVKTDGAKGYESLLELETSAHDFKLACILVGLDEEKTEKPRFQFDEREIEGQALDIELSWNEDGQQKTVKASTALSAVDRPFDDHRWVYVGSIASPQDGSLMAELSGTLIGFVHDPLSVIEHRTGAGYGAYGAITGNSKLLPPVGSPVTIAISVVDD